MMKCFPWLNSAISAMGEGILVIDVKNGITYFNTRLLKMWKIPEPLINQDHIEELIK